jgi:ABC-type lipoprotein export system ATPase subunit
MRLRIQDVWQTYHERGGHGVEALAGVTFTVEPEELVAVVVPGP